jgi:hypothetical protein
MFAPRYWFDQRTKKGRPAKQGFNGPLLDYLKSKDFICSRASFRGSDLSGKSHQ